MPVNETVVGDFSTPTKRSTRAPFAVVVTSGVAKGGELGPVFPACWSTGLPGSTPLYGTMPPLASLPELVAAAQLPALTMNGCGAAAAFAAALKRKVSCEMSLVALSTLLFVRRIETQPAGAQMTCGVLVVGPFMFLTTMCAIR